jgi:AcrR family transcriptional regulator
MESSSTRERILDAAERVVARLGFAKATMDDIALESNMSKGGFLYHFPTKRECYLALIDRTFDRILEDATELVRGMPDGPGRKLKAYIIAWLEWQEPPHQIQIKGLLEDDILRERLVDHRIRHFELVQDERLPPLCIETALLICAGLWSTPLLARATHNELSLFRLAMRDKILGMIDRAVADAR